MAQAYPLPVFHFQVEWGGTRIGFTEVSGLDYELQPIEYREGSSFNYNVTKMPGMPKFGNITLKRGVIKGDNDFAKWITTVKLNQI
ncbi:MAG: phage tail protein, partial [Bacteroidia bacterium]